MLEDKLEVQQVPEEEAQSPTIQIHPHLPLRSFNRISHPPVRYGTVEDSDTLVRGESNVTTISQE